VHFFTWGVLPYVSSVFSSEYIEPVIQLHHARSNVFWVTAAVVKGKSKVVPMLWLSTTP
jgi:hypothetical protein